MTYLVRSGTVYDNRVFSYMVFADDDNGELVMIDVVASKSYAKELAKKRRGVIARMKVFRDYRDLDNE